MLGLHCFSVAGVEVEDAKNATELVLGSLFLSLGILKFVRSFTYLVVIWSHCFSLFFVLLCVSMFFVHSTMACSSVMLLLRICHANVMVFSSLFATMKSSATKLLVSILRLGNTFFSFMKSMCVLISFT